MIDFQILRKHGTTNERLKEIFTAVAPQDTEVLTEDDRRKRELDVAQKNKVEERIQSRLSEQILHCVKNYKTYAAVDLAWDSNVLTGLNLPLLQYAQGRIKVESCVQQLQALPNADKYLARNDKGEATGINLPVFLDVECNLVRSFVTRRLAAQSNKYSNLWPYYKYESRSTGPVGKLRADVMSQRADIMADQFGYREHDKHVYRDMFLFAHSVDFVRTGWEIDRQLAARPAIEELASEEPEVEEEIVREGIGWVAPHPSRVFWDNAYPLVSINSDSGCEYVGYWDVRRYKDVASNPAYWNREAISYGSTPWLWTIFSSYEAYWNQYYTQVLPPPSAQLTRVPVNDIAGANDRSMNVGVYNAQMPDSAVFVTEYYEKVIPAHFNCGTYPYPVWTRFTVAGDHTVIFAEFLPSSPGAYCGLNESENRQVNVSFAHDLIAWQDQMNNLINAMILTVKEELVKVFGVDTDMVSDEKVLKQLDSHFQGNNWPSKPLLLKYSRSQAMDEGIKPDKAFEIAETRAGQSLTSILQAMIRLVDLVEKLNAMSPAEMGQPAPREITATESNEMSATTQSVYTFISDAIDSFHAAKKRIIYESVVSRQQGRIRLPVINRYSAQTIKKAGFQEIPDEIEDSSQEVSRRTVIGTASKLAHDYIFTTRDGSERPTNVQAANTLVQLLAQLVSIPIVLQGMGKDRLFAMVNEIFLLIGAGFDLRLELDEGEDNSMGVDQIEQIAQQVQQLAQMTTQLAQAVSQNTERIGTSEKSQGDLVEKVAELADRVKQQAQQLAIALTRTDQKPRPEIQYKEAPPDVQRQIEADQGYVPSKLPPEPVEK